MSKLTLLAGGNEAFTSYRSNSWNSEDTGTNQASAATVGNDVIFAQPMQARALANIIALAMAVGTAVPGALGRHAIYAGRSDQPIPGALLFGSLTSLDFGLAAGTALVTTVPNVIIPEGGIFWIASKHTGGAQPKCYNGNTVAGPLATWQGRLLGASSAIGALGIVDPANQPMCVSAADAFLNAWPTMFPTPSFNLQFAPMQAWQSA